MFMCIVRKCISIILLSIVYVWHALPLTKAGLHKIQIQINLSNPQRPMWQEFSATFKTVLLDYV